MMNNRSLDRTYRLCCIGLMTALAFAANYIQIPFLASRIHTGNAICALCGMILGPLIGFLTAGLGNCLFDVLNGWAIECWVTFITKGCIALVTALVLGGTLKGEKLSGKGHARIWISAAAGALTYVLLYVLKSWLLDPVLYAYPREQIGLIVAGKLPASLLNAAFAAVAAPVLMTALIPPLRSLGVLKAGSTERKQ